MALQTLITLALIVFAAAFVWRRSHHLFSRPSSSGCGGCNGCSGGNSEAAIKITPLVQLGTNLPNKTSEQRVGR